MKNAMSRSIGRVAVGFIAMAMMVVAPSAGAKIHDVDAEIYEAGVVSPEKSVVVRMDGLDDSKATNLRVRRPGVVAPVWVKDFSSGESSLATDEITPLLPGDRIEVRQPLNAVEPTDVIELPEASISFAGLQVAGKVGQGNLVWLSGLETCLEDDDRRFLIPGATYSAEFGTAAAPGRIYALNFVGEGGFRFRVLRRAPGERPCVRVGGASDELRNPGSALPQPHDIYVSDLDPVMSSSLLVVRRSGQKIFERLSDSVGYIFANTRVQVLPGDRIEIHRPSSEVEPTHVIEIPPISVVFDPDSEIAAVRGPALRSASVVACRIGACDPSVRTLLDRPAGESRLDFRTREGASLPFDLLPTDQVHAYVQFADRPLQYSFDATIDDLTAPSFTVSAPRRVRASTLRKSLKRGYRLMMRSSEPATADLRLVSRGLTLATASTEVGVGKGSVRLRFTTAGRKRVRTWARRGRKLKTERISLQSTLTDSAGNRATSVRKIDLRR